MHSVKPKPQVRQPPCFTRPPEWWDVDNDGARLAILLCLTACPQTDACDRTANLGAAGTVRGGRPYGDHGPMAVCHCGYPTPKADTCCARCGVPNVSIMSRREHHRLYARRRTWAESKRRARAKD